MKESKGFTLIEAIVYLALFAIIIGGAFVAAYGMIESMGRNQTKAMVVEEGNFLAAKINWALSGAEAINSPAATGIACPASVCPLSITKWDTSIGNPVVVNLVGTDMTIARAAGVPKILNNSNVQITSLSFTHTSMAGDGINPESVQADFTMGARTPRGVLVSQDFSVTSYLKK